MERVERVFKYTVITRVTHWIHFVSMVMLIFTGFTNHFPSIFAKYLSMDAMRFLHYVFMYLIVCNMIFQIYYMIATGEVKFYILRWEDLLDLPALIRFYSYGIFTGATRKHWWKFNPGQKIIYGAWPFLLVLQTITGFILYWPQTLKTLSDFFNPGKLDRLWNILFADSKLYYILTSTNGLDLFRALHVFIAWLFLALLLAHLYLGSTAKMGDYYKSMFTGYKLVIYK